MAWEGTGRASAYERARAACLVAALVLTAVCSSVHLLLPAAVLFLLIPGAHKPYRMVVTAVSTCWFMSSAALLEWISGTRFLFTGVGSTPPPPSERVSLVICNHRCRLDWLFLWPFFARAGCSGRLKIALKGDMKTIPFFGWAMQSFLFLFLTRSDRDADLTYIQRLLQHCLADGAPMALLIFPEGVIGLD